MPDDTNISIDEQLESSSDTLYFFFGRINRGFILPPFEFMQVIKDIHAHKYSYVTRNNVGTKMALKA